MGFENTLRTRDKVKEIILLVHGVESNAEGMERLRGLMYEDERFPFESCRIKIHRYYNFPVVMAIYKTFQDAYTDLLAYHIENLTQKYRNLKKIKIVAHSWGTFLTYSVIKNYYADKNIQQEIELLLLGAVCPGVKKYECFPLQRVNKVTNITGSKDIVVRAAGLFPGYEATGYKGFNEIYGFKNIKTDWNHTGYANRKNLKFIMDELGK